MHLSKRIIAMAERPHQKQRRTAPRIRVVNTFAWVHVKSSLIRRGTEKKVSIVDLGPKGMSFEWPEAQQPGTVFKFVIDLPDERRIKGKGTVRNFRKWGDQYILGAEFLRLSRDDRAYLVNVRNILALSERNLLDVEMPLRNKLKWLRATLGITIMETSEMTGVSPSFISGVENGIEINPPQDQISKLAGNLSVSLSDLIGRESEATGRRGSRPEWNNVPASSSVPVYH